MALDMPFSASTECNLLIDGRTVPPLSGAYFETRNPATGAVLARVAQGEAADIDLAVAAARRAFEGGWSRFTPFDRQQCLLKLADLVDRDFEAFSMLDTLDMGAPISFTRGRRQRAIGMLRFYAGLCTAIHGKTLPNSLPGDVFSYTLKEPVGVVGAITPWNAPLTSTIWKLGPVLATGCTAVLKPSEEAPLTALRLGELILAAGFPAGVVNVVPGFGESAGAALAAHPGVDKIAFTGSDVTGRKIIAASCHNVARVTLELGGKSPDIVFADAKLQDAVAGAGMGVFHNTGQICSAGTRILVERPIYEAFAEQLVAFAQALRVGDGVDPQTQIGPVVSARQLQRVNEYLEIGAREGAVVQGGGRRDLAALSGGHFIEPAVLAGVRNDMRVAQEEIFGPVACLIPFESEAEAFSIANATAFGLGAGVWTQNLSRAHRAAKAIRAGTVWVNCYGLLDPVIPFGGYKASGYGRESGTQHVEDYLQTKSVVMRN
jgi:aldehyde dehydrogenase (NAD+)